MNAERHKYNTDLIKSNLLFDESFIFWKRQADLSTKDFKRITREDWFQYSNKAKYRYIINFLQRRYGNFPNAWLALKLWSSSMTEDDIRHVAHFHLCLVDPLYRKVAGNLIFKTSQNGSTYIDKNKVNLYAEVLREGHWNSNTTKRIVGNIIKTMSQVRLLEQNQTTKKLWNIKSLNPSSIAIEYICYVLREIEYKDNIFDNIYWKSFGFNRMVIISQISDTNLSILSANQLQYSYDSIQSWATNSFKG